MPSGQYDFAQKNSFLVPYQKRHQLYCSQPHPLHQSVQTILPEMKFKDSNIGTEFLALGKKEDMSRFVIRADEEFEYNTALFEIPEREGLYYEKPNFVDKYFRRGNVLAEISHRTW